MAKRRAEQLLAKEKQREAIRADGTSKEGSGEGTVGGGGTDAVDDLKEGVKAIEI